MYVSIVLADDHQVVVEGLTAVLQAEPGLRVVGHALDGGQVVEVVERLRPDVLVCDLMMPGVNGLEVTRRLHQQRPQLKIIVLSMHAHESYVFDALRSGASGYVLKAAQPGELVRAIRAVSAGRRYLSPPLSAETLAEYERRSSSATIDPYDTLTLREHDVLKLAAEGLTNSEIASRLQIGRRTVESHRAHLIAKLGLKSHTDLVRIALRRGLIASE